MAEPIHPSEHARRSSKSKPSRRRRANAGHKRPIGAPPGTVAAAPEANATTIRAIAYGPDTLRELDGVTTADLDHIRGEHSVLWVDVIGLGDTQTLRTIGEQFGLHPLALEDAMNVVQRPKIDDYDDRLYIVTRIVHEGRAHDTEQISVFVGPGFVVTFQEREGDCFEPIRERLRHSRGRIRGADSDYLAYALLDAVVDHYFPVVEAYGERIEQLEDHILERAGSEEITALLDLRHELITLRRVIHGLRDVLSRMLKEDLPVVTNATRVYVRDGHDHALRLLGDVEGWRELTSSLMEVHRSVMGQQLNSVMKVLTIIATIFIPLGFIAGLYGMNFDPDRSAFNMPELRWTFGYPFALLLMVVVAAGQLLYFRRRGWLGSS